MQLLGDVEGLKAAQELPRPGGVQTSSMNSYDNLRTLPEGYEPEGQAGTGSPHPTGSGYFSNPSTRQPSAMRGMDGRKVSEHRISTVPEGDEDFDGGVGRVENEDDLLTPTRQSPRLQVEEQVTPRRDTTRGTSVPLETPPQTQPASGSRTAENTPRTDKGRKHKSNSSSIFPKISRWSETTASTVARQFRGNGRRAKDVEPPSRSGSEVESWGELPSHEVQGGDRLPYAYSREQTPTGHDARPASPLIPQDTQDDPKYQVHRNSLNLQHPQPRPGPTYRYQNQLESQIDNYGYTPSISSDAGLSSQNANRYSVGSGQRYSGTGVNLSPISYGGYSGGSAADQTAPPPRPPKIPDEPLVPAPLGRDNKSRFSDASGASQVISSLRRMARLGLTRGS